MNTLREAWRYFRQYKGVLLLTLLLGIIATALNMVRPYIPKLIFDRVIEQGERSLLMPLLGALMIITVLRHGIQYVRSYLTEKFSMKVMKTMRADAFQKFLSLSFRFFDKEKTGQLMTLISWDSEAVKDMFASTIPAIIEMSLSFLFAGIILFTLSPWLALGCLIIMPVVYLLTKHFSKDMASQHMEIREQAAALSTVAQENINGVRVVRAFSKEAYENERFERESKEFMKVHIETSRVWAKYHWKLSLTGNYPYIIVMFFGALMMIDGQLTLGSYISIIGYIEFIMNPINAISGYVSSLQHAMAAGNKLFSFLYKKPEIKNIAHPKIIQDFKGEIVFDQVSLKYEGKTALHEVSLRIKPGMKLGVMGETGSGKSSFINLLGRFYDCTSGAIQIDGIDIRELELAFLRSKISYVMQDVFLFSETIRKNITLGNSAAQLEEIEHAVKLADAYEFIQRMPQEYETIVGERGIGLSGGQKQRISIARAALANAPILILDDATSSVDMETEHQIQQAMDDVFKDKTRIVCSNRVSAVENADEILFFKNGRIAERGNHQKLMQMNGHYAQIVHAQCGTQSLSNIRQEVLGNGEE